MSQTKDLINLFDSWKVIHIKRSENKHVDALSKLASTSFDHLAKDVRFEVLDKPSVPQLQVLVIQTEVTSWMTPIIDYLSSGVLPDENSRLKKFATALNYQLQDRILYRQSFLGPLLRCVDVENANYLSCKIHEGICGLHAGLRTVVAKIMNVVYYWSRMHLDALQEIRKCESCQRHAPNILRPQIELMSVSSVWPFQKWAVDFIGSQRPQDASNF